MELSALNSGCCIRAEELASAEIKKRLFSAAVNLDMKNAFNSIPWPRIIETFENARVTVYMQKIILCSYLGHLDCRTIGSREVTCGVSQESVFGPSLWNVGLDVILRLKLPPEMQLICHANDTLVVCSAEIGAEGWIEFISTFY